MIDTRPYLDEIRDLLIEVLWANPCSQGEEWLCRLYATDDLSEAFPGYMSLDPKGLIRRSYEWARHAKNKRRPTLVDVMRLRFYDVPNRMYRDELRLTGSKSVDGKANLVVRPAAQVAAMYGSWAVTYSAELTPERRAYWANVIYIVNRERLVR